jgi:hypothetical protein
MKAVKDDNHDSLIATFQTIEAIKLNDALKGNGIADIELRRQIISEYLFSIGVIFDQCYFVDNGKRSYAGMYFADRKHDEIDSAVISLPGQYGMNLHDYAFGAADWAIENNEQNGEDMLVGNE